MTLWPEPVSYEGGARGASIRIRWRGARSAALPVYAALFNVMLAILATGQGTFGAVHRTLMAFAIVPLSYFVIVHLTNATTLSVAKGLLVVRHGPLPWRQRVVLPLVDVARLSVERQNARLLLFTRRGEELTLLDDLRQHAVAELDGLLDRALAQAPPATASASDGATP